GHNTHLATGPTQRHRPHPRLDQGGVDAPRVRPPPPRLSPLWRPAARHRHHPGPGRGPHHPRPPRPLALHRGARPRPTRARCTHVAPASSSSLDVAPAHSPAPPPPPEPQPSARSLTTTPTRWTIGRPAEAIARATLAFALFKRAIPGVRLELAAKTRSWTRGTCGRRGVCVSYAHRVRRGRRARTLLLEHGLIRNGEA